MLILFLLGFAAGLLYCAHRSAAERRRQRAAEAARVSAELAAQARRWAVWAEREGMPESARAFRDLGAPGRMSA